MNPRPGKPNLRLCIASRRVVDEKLVEEQKQILGLTTANLHPSDEDLSPGTPELHPSDEDLSPGTPELHPVWGPFRSG